MRQGPHHSAQKSTRMGAPGFLTSDSKLPLVRVKMFLLIGSPESTQRRKSAFLYHRHRAVTKNAAPTLRNGPSGASRTRGRHYMMQSNRNRIQARPRWG